MASESPPRAKLVGGVYLPETETHLEEWMTTSKGAREVEGKLTYQYSKIEAALRHQPADRRGTAVDVGAHVGLWSMWLALEFERLLAFEPTPIFWELWRRNVANAPESDCVCQLAPLALGASEDVTSIRVPLGSTGATHLAGRAPINEKFDASAGFLTFDSIEVRTLDSYRLMELDFLKVDVEGVEADVLRGSKQTIRECRPNIVVEQKGNDAAYGETPGAAVEILKSWGMKPLEVISGDWIMAW